MVRQYVLRFGDYVLVKRGALYNYLDQTTERSIHA